MRALADHGPCPEHRVSFANVHGLADGCLAEPGSSFDDAVAGPGRDGAGSAAVDSARDVARHAMSGQFMGGELTYGSSHPGRCSRRWLIGGPSMSAEELQKYEAAMELPLYREHPD